MIRPAYATVVLTLHREITLEIDDAADESEEALTDRVTQLAEQQFGTFERWQRQTKSTFSKSTTSTTATTDHPPVTCERRNGAKLRFAFRTASPVSPGDHPGSRPPTRGPPQTKRQNHDPNSPHLTRTRRSRRHHGDSRWHAPRPSRPHADGRLAYLRRLQHNHPLRQLGPGASARPPPTGRPPAPARERAHAWTSAAPSSRRPTLPHSKKANASRSTTTPRSAVGAKTKAASCAKASAKNTAT